MYGPYVGSLCKFFFFSSAIHQLVFCLFSSLPFAVGEGAQSSWATRMEKVFCIQSCIPYMGACHCLLILMCFPSLQAKSKMSDSSSCPPWPLTSLPSAQKRIFPPRRLSAPPSSHLPSPHL